jgi:hypothetical protein
MLLWLIGAALVTGQLTPSAISQWIREHAKYLRAVVGPPLPSDATIRRTLQRVDVIALEACFRQSLSARSPMSREARALDGRAVRGTGMHGHPRHLVSEVCHDSGQVVQQTADRGARGPVSDGRQRESTGVGWRTGRAGNDLQQTVADLIAAGRRREEVCYGLTSLSWQQASAADLERLWRRHWHIENKVHYVRDVTWREDASQCWIGHALAALHNGLTNLLRQAGANCQRALRFIGLLC